MKDTRFIELINLYVDRQISPEETAELEAEIQASPRRRSVYRQYCQMHHATKLVYESFRSQADQPAGAETPRQPGSIAHFASRRRAQQRARWVYATGGLAAAACLAFVFARLNLPAKAPAEATLPAVAAATVAVQPVATPATSGAKVINFSAAVREEPDYAAMLASLRQEEQRSFALSQAVRNSALFDDGVFEGRQVLPLNARRPAPVRKADGRTSAEFTAFQFQR
jgi:anti-sigma factor RsiW